jgi:DNA-directed RNA polymerase subunit RPC12/RpoP
MEMPAGDCPACGSYIKDWHVEWLAPPNQGPVFRGQAAIECPDCGAPILVTKNQNVVGVAPPGTPVMKRSRTQAEKWAKARSISLDDYLQQNGSQYKDHEFEP